MKNNNTYGILLNGCHVDVSKTERGAKIIATKLGIKTITIRYNNGYIAAEIATKRNNKWVALTNGQPRYNNQ